MATITAKDVAALRAKTGIGMMECKKALVEADGDMDAAVKLLREKGQLKAEGKAGRIAADGIVDIMKEGNKTAMIEVNSETDFVAKNASFQAFVKDILKVILKENPADVDALLACNYIDGSMTVDAKLKEMIFVIGEKLSIRRFVVVEGTVSTYIHGLGSIGVIVKFDADDAVVANPGFAQYAKNLALQVAADPVAYLCREQVPASVIEEEKSILMAQIANDPANAKKPPQIIEKMVAGRIAKYYDTHCLFDMAYVKEDNMKVSQYIAASEKELGGKAAVVSYVRYEKGEGIEKREDNFAEEIAKMTGKA